MASTSARVRLHEGRPADELAGSLDAEAFTVGNDVFARGQRNWTVAGDGPELLAHELSHVAQQQGATAMVQRMPRPEWLKRLARRLRSGDRGTSEAVETPYQPIPAFAPESPYQPIPGFPGGDRGHRFSGAYNVRIPAHVDDEPEGGHYNTIPNFDDEPEGGHYNTIPNFDDEPEGGHYNTIPNFDDEPEGGHYNTIPNFDDEPEGWPLQHDPELRSAVGQCPASQWPVRGAHSGHVARTGAARRGRGDRHGRQEEASQAGALHVGEPPPGRDRAGQVGPAALSPRASSSSSTCMAPLIRSIVSRSTAVRCSRSASIFWPDSNSVRNAANRSSSCSFTGSSLLAQTLTTTLSSWVATSEAP